MTSLEYKQIITLIDEALQIQSTSTDRVGDISFRADLGRTRGKAAQEMAKASLREQGIAPNGASRLFAHERVAVGATS